MLPIVIAAIESPEDHDRMVAFYEQYHRLLYREAGKYLPDCQDVEDTVCEALTRIIDKMDVFRNLARPQQVSYALTAVRNLAYLLLKRKNHFTMVSFEDLEGDLLADHSTEEVVEQGLRRDYIQKVWSGLDLDTRMLLEQKYILKWTDEELARQLGIQPQSVRMRLTRAKRSLMEALKNQGFHPGDWL